MKGTSCQQLVLILTVLQWAAVCWAQESPTSSPAPSMVPTTPCIPLLGFCEESGLPCCGSPEFICQPYPDANSNGQEAFRRCIKDPARTGFSPGALKDLPCTNPALIRCQQGGGNRRRLHNRNIHGVRGVFVGDKNKNNNNNNKEKEKERV